MKTAKIRIGGQERDLGDADPSWIAQQIDGRRRDGERVCVEVTLNGEDCNLRLHTPGCSSGVGGRRANCEEQEIIDLWNRNRLGSDDYAPGNVIAFVQQLRRHLS